MEDHIGVDKQKKSVLGKAFLSNMIQIMLGVGAGGGLLFAIGTGWSAYRKKRAVYVHISCISSFAQEEQTHQCVPTHWHTSMNYRRVEPRVTKIAQYAIVRSEWNKHYYALGEIARPAYAWGPATEVFGIVVNGHLIYYVFLPDQDTNGFATLAEIRFFIDGQQNKPVLPPVPKLELASLDEAAYLAPE